MAQVTAGAMIEKVFSQEGVRYIFGIPGGHIYPMMDSCDEKGIKFIGVRHEMNAAFMAEGWALTTGTTGVCSGTAGPGFTNLVTGLANADRNGAPVLCMAGKAKITEYDRNELQDFNQIDMVKGMTKHARSVIEGHRIPEYVGRALAETTSGTPGPAYIEIPRDIMESSFDEEKVEYQQTYRVPSRPLGNPADIDKAVRLLNQAQHPVVIAGSGCFWSGAAEELRLFLDKYQAPIWTRNAGRGIIPDSHPLAMGIGASKLPMFQNVCKQADAILILGTRTGYTMTRDVFPTGAKIIRVDINGAALTNQLDITVGIVGDCREVIRQITEGVDKKSFDGWVEGIRQGKSQMAQAVLPLLTSDQYPIHPMRLCFEILKRADQDTVLVVDGGDSASWDNLILPANGPGQFLTIANGSFGPLGVGVPYAMAAKLAHPDKKVILLTGDGAFGYGAMEYDTAMRYGINFTTVILNDSCWGMIKRSEAKKAAEGKKPVGLFLRDVRYDQVVTALGGHGEFVTQAEEIGPAIDRALASDLPACVNVITDVNIGFGV